MVRKTPGAATSCHTHQGPTSDLEKNGDPPNLGLGKGPSFPPSAEVTVHPSLSDQHRGGLSFTCRVPVFLGSVLGKREG